MSASRVRRCAPGPSKMDLARETTPREAVGISSGQAVNHQIVGGLGVRGENHPEILASQSLWDEGQHGWGDWRKDGETWT
eukprot:3642111-Pyramimonas_sp.AAC.1